MLWGVPNWLLLNMECSWYTIKQLYSTLKFGNFIVLIIVTYLIIIYLIIVFTIA